MANFDQERKGARHRCHTTGSGIPRASHLSLRQPCRSTRSFCREFPYHIQIFPARGNNSGWEAVERRAGHPPEKIRAPTLAVVRLKERIRARPFPLSTVLVRLSPLKSKEICSSMRRKIRNSCCPSANPTSLRVTHPFVEPFDGSHA